MKSSVPGYIYDNKFDRESLQQGDVIKVQNELINKFNEFYPTLNHTDQRNDQFVMILSQTCDLVRTKKRKLKIDHINLCLVRTIDSLIRRTIENHQGDMDKSFYKETSKKLSRLINNSETKFHFFLPKIEGVFPKDMISILSLNYAFRTNEFYELFLSNRVASLKSEFRAKIGMILSAFYGRVATQDLSEQGWTDEDCSQYVNQLIANEVAKYQG
ncbi:MAG: hypothetical protein QNJ31_04995 [Candidatus Caenarcaniphilales bacterium]|nr:hypothetical protein [Candidatus Caenarcaniphilales bacterium]